MTAIDDAIALRRDALISDLHGSLRDKLSVAEITAAVDRALDVAGVQVALETVVAADAAVAAYAGAYPTPPPTVAAAVTGYQDQGVVFNNHYNGEFVSEP